MPRGTVKDPAGHQSPDHEFGYIQRIPGNEEGLTFDDLKWGDGSQQVKVIPFLNRIHPDDGNPLFQKAGSPEDFTSVTAYVYVKNGEGETLELGNIGIAVLDQQKTIRKFLGLE